MQVVGLSNVVAISGGYEVNISAQAYKVAGTGSVHPLAMNNKSLGGGNFFPSGAKISVQIGITGASGLNNIGMLVTKWGRVASFQAEQGQELGLLTMLLRLQQQSDIVVIR